MNLYARSLTEEDYNLLCEWWAGWRWTPPPREILPDNGTCGVIIEYEGVPICAGFLYITNSPMSWIEWVVSDVNFKDRQVRRMAIDMLLETLSRIAKTAGATHCYSVTRPGGWAECLDRNGFNLTGENMLEYVKPL